MPLASSPVLVVSSAEVVVSAADSSGAAVVVVVSALDSTAGAAVVVVVVVLAYAFDSFSESFDSEQPVTANTIDSAMSDASNFFIINFSFFS